MEGKKKDLIITMLVEYLQHNISLSADCTMSEPPHMMHK